MLKRRKVETRKQYEKRIRRRQIAFAALCGVEDNLPQPQHRSRWSKPQSPVSPYVREGDAVLEIYDRHAAQTINKRRRPRGRSELYRQFEVNLSSSSSSSHPESAHTQSFSEDILSNEESMLSLLQKEEHLSVQRSGVTSAANVKGNDKRTVAAVVATNDSVVCVKKPWLQKTAQSDENLSSKISKGVQTGMGFLCCHFLLKHDKVINLRSGPGMSLTEEKRLWRIALEGEEGTRCRLGPSGNKRQIREIEVIPVDQSFQTTGAINYAEMEGIGMVFAPAVLQKAPVSPSIAPVPWWKRDSWIGLSSDDRGPDRQDQSAARTSAYTKKASNKRTQPLPQVKETSIPTAREAKKKNSHRDISPSPIDLTDRDDSSSDIHDASYSTVKERVAVDLKRGKKPVMEDISFSDLDESLDQRITRGSKVRTLQVKQEAFQLAKSRGQQPLQTFNAKPGRRAGLAERRIKSSGQKGDRQIYIPTLNHIYDDPMLDSRLDISTKKPVQDLFHCDSDSRMESESDLSLLVRQLDSKHKSRAPSPKLRRQSDLLTAVVPSVDSDITENIGQSASPLLVALLAESIDSSSNDPAALLDNKGFYERQEKGKNQPENFEQKNTRDDPAPIPRLQNPSDGIIGLVPSSPHSVDRPLVLNDRTKNDDIKHAGHGSIPFEDVFLTDSPRSKGLSKVSSGPHCSPTSSPYADENKRRLGNDSQSPIRLYENSPVVVEGSAPSEPKDVSGFGRQSRRAREIALTSCGSRIRKRSQSPVRLYGDPPIPIRMDGSPVRSGCPFEPRQRTRSQHKESENVNGAREGSPQRQPELRELTCSQRNCVDAMSHVSSRHVAAPNLSSSPRKALVARSEHSLSLINLCSSQAGAPSSLQRDNCVIISLVENDPRDPVHQDDSRVPVFSRNSIPMFVKSEGFNFDDDSLTASPWMNSLELEGALDDNSITDELLQLEASEELLRKELNEIQLQREKLKLPTTATIHCDNLSPIDCTRFASSSSLLSERHSTISHLQELLENRHLQLTERHRHLAQLSCLSTDNDILSEVVDVTTLSSASTVRGALVASSIIDLVLLDEMDQAELGGLNSSLPIAPAYHHDTAVTTSKELPHLDHGPFPYMGYTHQDSASYDKIEVVFDEHEQPKYPTGESKNAPVPKLPSTNPPIIGIPENPRRNDSPRSPSISRRVRSPGTEQYSVSPRNVHMTSSRRDESSERFSPSSVAMGDWRSPISSPQYSSASQRALIAVSKNDVRSPVSSTQYSEGNQRALHSVMKSDFRSPISSTQYSCVTQRALNSSMKSDLRSPISSAQYSGISQRALNSMDMLRDESCDGSVQSDLGPSRKPAVGEPVPREVDESEDEDSLRDSDGRYLSYFVGPTSPHSPGGFGERSDDAAHGGADGGLLDRTLLPHTLAVVRNVGESLVDRELSWQSVEQLYQLSPQADACERRETGRALENAWSSSGFTANDWNFSSRGRMNTNLPSVREDPYYVDSPPGSPVAFEDKMSALKVQLETRGVRQDAESPVLPRHTIREDFGLESPGAGLYSSTSFESDLDLGADRRIENQRVDTCFSRSMETASETNVASRVKSSPLYSAYADTRYQLETDDESDTLGSAAVSLTSSMGDEVHYDENESRFVLNVQFDENDAMSDPKVSRPTPSHDLDVRRRLQSLKQRHQHLYYRDHIPKGTARALEQAERNMATLGQAADADQKVRFNLDSDTDAKAGVDRNKRLGRLKKHQLRMHQSVNEQTRINAQAQKPPTAQLKRRTRTGVGLPRAFTEHYGQTSKKKPTVPNSNVNSGMLVEVFMPIIGAPLGGERKELKRNADHATRDHSISSSTTRSRELVHALPSSARSRNVAAAKPGRRQRRGIDFRASWYVVLKRSDTLVHYLPSLPTGIAVRVGWILALHSVPRSVLKDTVNYNSATMADMTSLIPNALGSATAGIVSRIVTHPLDTVKARLQAPPGSTPPYAGPFDALRRTAQNEGIRGLYRGFGAVIVGGTPGTVLYLCTYDICKSLLSNGSYDEDHFAVHFASGMLAETVSCIVYVPVDVIKERMQVQHSDSSFAANKTPYLNSWDALKQVSQKEGLRGVYKGYGATLASFGPFSALYFVFYERFKSMTQQHLRLSGPSDVPFQWTVLNSALAGALASWLTSPLDMAKLRLQVQRGNRYTGGAMTEPINDPAHYTGMIDCLRRSFREGGMKALFRGAGARVLHFAPATTVTMTTYETCRSFISQALASNV